MVNNYRILFDNPYRNTIGEVSSKLGLMSAILQVARNMGIEDIWYFNEYKQIELTWICDDPELSTQFTLALVTVFSENDIEFRKHLVPSDGFFAAWFGESQEEKEFNYKTFKLHAQLAELFYEYQEPIVNGKGLEKQYTRRCHVMANMLGLDYSYEGWWLLKYSVHCLLFHRYLKLVLWYRRQRTKLRKSLKRKK